MSNAILLFLAVMGVGVGLFGLILSLLIGDPRWILFAPGTLVCLGMIGLAQRRFRGLRHASVYLLLVGMAGLTYWAMLLMTGQGG